MATPITIHVDGYEASRVEDWLTDHVARAVKEQHEAFVAKAASERISALVSELSHERIQAEIDAVLAEGWTETTKYGEPTGKKHTVRDRVRGFFDAKEGYENKPRVDTWVKEGVQGALAKALDEEVKSAKARMREAFDAVLQAKFTTTIREALGVK